MERVIDEEGGHEWPLLELRARERTLLLFEECGDEWPHSLFAFADERD